MTPAVVSFLGIHSADVSACRELLDVLAVAVRFVEDKVGLLKKVLLLVLLLRLVQWWWSGGGGGGGWLWWGWLIVFLLRRLRLCTTMATRDWHVIAKAP